MHRIYQGRQLNKRMMVRTNDAIPGSCASLSDLALAIHYSDKQISPPSLSTIKKRFLLRIIFPRKFTKMVLPEAALEYIMSAEVVYFRQQDVLECMDRCMYMITL